MYDAKMKKVCLVLWLLLSLLHASIGRGGEITTNDVDAIFCGVDAFSINRLSTKCTRDGLKDVYASQPHIAAYAFDRLIAISVSTNMPRASYLLREKAELLTYFDMILGLPPSKVDLRKILDSARTTLPVATNDIRRLIHEAIELDRQIEPWRRWMGHSGNPGKNFARCRAMARCAHEWNHAVETYRLRLIVFVCRTYRRIHPDVPEAERREALRALLREYGFSLPDPEPTDRELHTFEHSLPPGLF